MNPVRGFSVAALALALFSFGGQGLRVWAEGSPMAGAGDAYVADPQAVDDEPPGEPAPVARDGAPTPKLPPVEKAAPALQPGRIMTPYPTSDAPLPPRRPFSEQVVQPPPEAAPPPEAPNEEARDEPAAEGEMPPAEGQKVSREELEREEDKTPEPSLVEKQTDAVNIACLKPELMAIVQKAGQHFGGTPVITSGQRSRGRRGSFHRKCMAADFIIPGIERSRVARFLRALPEAGGVGTYCHTKSVHIDIGEPRNWYQCGFRFRFAQR